MEYWQKERTISKASTLARSQENSPSMASTESEDPFLEVQS